MKLSEVTCDFLINKDRMMPTEEVKAEWAHYSAEERQGWFTTVCVRQKADARAVLNDIIEQMAYEGYEEMDVTLKDCITDDDVTKLQELLDSIFDNSVADVYSPDVEIEVED
ncbi:UNVERIFIED_CONTAM: hypothetical protein KB574_09430 [Streptococcus canis]